MKLNKVFLLVTMLVLYISEAWSCQSIQNNAHESKAKITIYTTSWCPYCNKTKALLDDLNVNYINCDIETSYEANQQYQRLGGGGIPIILIGNLKIHGFDPEAIVSGIEHLK